MASISDHVPFVATGQHKKVKLYLDPFLLYTHHHHPNIGQMATPPPLPGQRLPFQTVVNQAPSHVTNVYVGNLSPDTTGKIGYCLVDYVSSASLSCIRNRFDMSL